MSEFHLRPEEEHVYDKFAGQALNGLIIARLAKDSYFQTTMDASKTHTSISHYLSDLSFVVAEEMILERRKRKPITQTPLEPHN